MVYANKVPSLCPCRATTVYYIELGDQTWAPAPGAAQYLCLGLAAAGVARGWSCPSAAPLPPDPPAEWVQAWRAPPVCKTISILSLDKLAWRTRQLALAPATATKHVPGKLLLLFSCACPPGRQRIAFGSSFTSFTATLRRASAPKQARSEKVRPRLAG